jgi:hypothetical protein
MSLKVITYEATDHITYEDETGRPIHPLRLRIAPGKDLLYEIKDSGLVVDKMVDSITEAVATAEETDRDEYGFQETRIRISLLMHVDEGTDPAGIEVPAVLLETVYWKMGFGNEPGKFAYAGSTDPKDFAPIFEEDKQTFAETMRAGILYDLEEISESINFTTWYHAIEFVAWDLIHDRKPLMDDVHMVGRYDVADARARFEALGEWPDPRTDGESFIDAATFEPLYAAWTASEIARKQKLDDEDEARRVASLDDADMALLSLYEERASDKTVKLDVVTNSERVHKLKAKGLIAGRSWVGAEITDEGRELLASTRAPTP